MSLTIFFNKHKMNKLGPCRLQVTTSRRMQVTIFRTTIKLDRDSSFVQIGYLFVDYTKSIYCCSAKMVFLKSLQNVIECSIVPVIRGCICYGNLYYGKMLYYGKTLYVVLEYFKKYLKLVIIRNNNKKNKSFSGVSLQEQFMERFRILLGKSLVLIPKS